MEKERSSEWRTDDTGEVHGGLTHATRLVAVFRRDDIADQREARRIEELGAGRGKKDSCVYRGQIGVSSGG